MQKSYLLVFGSFVFASCAHYPDVRPTAKGVHSVVFSTESKGEGFQKAFAQAKDYCDDVHNKRAFQISEKSEYIGSMDEGSYNTAKSVSKVTSAVGAAGVVFGGKNEQKAGGVAAVGGGIANEAFGQGYRYTLKFKCQ